MVDLDLERFEIAAPAILTILVMPSSFSISTGIGVGMIALSALALATGHKRDVGWITHALAAVFLLHFSSR